ncbi:hypothetical protein IQ07DRAFT_636096 [Pyrenochaeta sp. DS3sAY3a]|nr:hypothetical protein IQ07DRAFT_636096 [Pyrenochaeta sp. DS3sAY3a]
MHFPTILALLATSLSATASPVEVEARQPAPPSIRGTFYLDTGCNASPPQGQFTFVQPAIGQCVNATVGPFVGTFFDQRTLTRTVRFQNQPCGFQGVINFIEIGPNTPDIPGCRNQAIRSYLTL